MKTFRVYLKNGHSLDIKALKFERPTISHANKFFNFYTTEGTTPDSNIYLLADEVICVVPVESTGSHWA